MSPFFEVFVAQIYSSSVFTDLTVGGARYISTGRGFATSRIPFSILYSRFADSSIYMGARLMLILLFGTVSHWQAPLLWFWASLSAFNVLPFIFNPHHLLGKTFSLITEISLDGYLEVTLNGTETHGLVMLDFLDHVSLVSNVS